MAKVNMMQLKEDPPEESSTEQAHDWVTVNSHEAMCSRCYITNRKAALFGTLNKCDGAKEPRTVFIPIDPYVPGCDEGYRHLLADNEIVCPDCKDHPCVDEFFEFWCRRCNANGFIKLGSEEL